MFPPRKQGPPPNPEQEALERAFRQTDQTTQQGLGASTTPSWGGGGGQVWGDPPQQGGGVWGDPQFNRPSGGGGQAPPGSNQTVSSPPGAVPPITVDSAPPRVDPGAGSQPTDPHVNVTRGGPTPPPLQSPPTGSLPTLPLPPMVGPHGPEPSGPQPVPGGTAGPQPVPGGAPTPPHGGPGGAPGPQPVPGGAGGPQPVPGGTAGPQPMPSGWRFTGNRGPGNPSDAEIWDFLQRNPGDEHRVAEAFGGVPPAPPTAPPVAPPVAPPTGGGGAPPGVTGDPGGPGGIGNLGGPTGGPNIPPNLQQLIPGLFTPQPPSPLQQQLTQGLQSLIQRGQTAPSLDDPTLAPVMDAYDRQQQRNAQRMRASLAERAAQTGTLNSGGFDTEALGYEADAGSNAAAFGADLVHGEQTARRNELMQGLQLAQSIGDNESARELQRQISLLDASLQQAGMTQQGGQFAQDLALRRELGLGGLDIQRSDIDLRRLLGLGGLGVQNRGLDIQRELGLGDLGVRNRSIDLQGLLGAGDLDIRNRGLTQQGQLGRGSLAMQLFQSLMGNQQFYDQMGMSAAQWQALLNQSAIQQLFQGL